MNFSSIAHSTIDISVARNIQSTPGPGRYNIASHSNSNLNDSLNKTFKLGNSKRELTVPLNSNPGPGEYLNEVDISKSKANYQHGIVIAKAKKKDIIEALANKINLETPGPGSYNTTMTEHNKKKGFHMTGKSQEIVDHKIPGPGSYEPDVSNVKNKVISVIISKTKRSDIPIISKDIKLLPGPGKYKAESSINSKHKMNNSYKFGKDEKLKPIKNVTPGPGQYKLPCSIRDVNDYDTKDGIFDQAFKYV